MTRDKHIDCREMWQRKMTKQGSCIEFNPAIAARNYTKTSFNINGQKIALLRKKQCHHFLWYSAFYIENRLSHWRLRWSKICLLNSVMIKLRRWLSLSGWILVISRMGSGFLDLMQFNGCTVASELESNTVFNHKSIT